MGVSMNEMGGPTGTGSPVAKWAKLGSEVNGLIVSEPFVEDDQDGKKVLKFDVETTRPVWISATKADGYGQALDTCTTMFAGDQYESVLVQAGAVVSCWLKQGWQLNAVKEAIAKSGADGIELGGQIQVKHHDLAAKRPGDAGRAKMFTARYKAPERRTIVRADDLNATHTPTRVAPTQPAYADEEPF